jgi:hypothetical protein
MIRKSRPNPQEPASSEEALAFVRKLQQEFSAMEHTPDNEKKLLERMNQFESGNLSSIARRVMMDIMKRPPPADGAGDRGSPPPSPTPPADSGPGSRKADAAGAQGSQRPEPDGGGGTQAAPAAPPHGKPPVS